MMPSTSDARSSSEEEPERIVELLPGESKKRRRRGRRTRKRSERGDTPASERSMQTPPLPLESRKRTCSLGAPPAPRNTNDFLLEDMEKREEDGVKRLRREERVEQGVQKKVSVDAEEKIAGEDEFEDQYEESWQECVVDKYKEMSHDELARRMAAMEKNRDEVERKLRRERSKSDYLLEKLQEAEEAMRERSEGSSPQLPTKTSPPSCTQAGLLSTLTAPNCSPNVISSPRA